MTIIKWTAIPLFLFTITGCDRKTDEIIACGDNQVLVIDVKASDKEDIRVLWSWKVSEATDLPEPYQKYLVPADECKPSADNKKILITSSGGGVVLVDRISKKSLFYTHSPMAHSAEFLPNDRVVIALSTDPGGNSLEVYDLKQSEKVIFKDSLFSGHGVVWMNKTRSLFAMGYNELRRYSLKNWNSDKPELQLEEKWILPDNGGHDLSPISDTRLVLSTTRSVWVFNLDDKQFSPFKLLGQTSNVKSVNYNESTDKLVYTKGEISWWTHNIYCRNPDKTLTLPDINLYKVRVVSK